MTKVFPGYVDKAHSSNLSILEGITKGSGIDPQNANEPIVFALCGITLAMQPAIIVCVDFLIIQFPLLS